MGFRPRGRAGVPMNIRTLTRGSGYLIEDSEHDTTNIICYRGHIYVDGAWLIASIDNATMAESRALRKIGEPVADGDFGELSVRFKPKDLPKIAQIMKPRQSVFRGRVA